MTKKTEFNPTEGLADDGPTPRVAIFGASVRAAAVSARRAGLEAVCYDQFADLDLGRAGNVLSPAETTTALCEAALHQGPLRGWLYTGGWEHDRERIAEMERRFGAAGVPLWGARAAQLALLRDPMAWTSWLRSAGLPHLAVCLETPPAGADGWMLKPYASGGGREIERWKPSPAPLPPGMYLQEYCEGPTGSALCLSSGEGVRVIGRCEDVRPVAGPSYWFHGSRGPLETSPELTARLTNIARIIARASGLRGLFGIDFALAGDVPYVLEINPRYTATVELYERSTGVGLLKEHAAAFAHAYTSMPTILSSGRQSVKQVLYAAAPFTAPDLTGLLNESYDPRNAWCADLPRPGFPIGVGDPICTIFGDGVDTAETHTRLELHYQRVSGLLPAGVLTPLVQFIER